ncbi:hypothetical protein FHS31_002227 [Sphingomonas vulcanisoli]|uniref:Uncharacterized protein n=1 Tax=Sphingomonas vulcanisoli TaxID=1658060 RepID=A0ABX0TY94_9SPHN|nr:hypothetical protein [Sphingomonas vulcanisoli]NIJ08606.1 hypothetical protein [Sphingomonas vulcanisoli]
MRATRWLAMLLIAGAARAEVAGPPVPPKTKGTAAEQAIALYHQEHDPAPLPTPCRRSTHDEITVCGKTDGRSPDRLPLPDQGGPRAGPRTATGEMPSTAGGVGGSPALQGKGAGLTLTVPLGTGTAPAHTAVTGNADE